MRLPDPQRSSAVLIGVGHYLSVQLDDIPAAGANLEALAEVLTDHELGGLSPYRCVTMSDPADPRSISDLVGMADDTEDMLLVYYVGHGLVGSDGRLYLGLSTTSLDDIEGTGLPFSSLRKLLLGSPARNRVLILDCSFGGRAVDLMAGQPAEMGMILGTFVWASTDVYSAAWAPVGMKHTAFTQALLDVIVEGIPAGPPLIPLKFLSDEVNKRLSAMNWPEPATASVHTAENLCLVRNAAYQSPAASVPMPPRWIVPPFDGELTLGRDLLGIRQDAGALAALIASAALKPPLAVGMFGEWGSGKTFLMRSLEREIDRLTRSGTPEFGRHVRSVWFNAWHYADANLWASLVHEIFHSLQGDHGPHPEQALENALTELAGIRQVTAEAAGHVAAAEKATQGAKDDLAGVEERYREATKSAAKVTGRDVWAAVTVDPALRQKLNDAATELGLPAVGESAREVAHAVDEVRATVRRGRLLATTGPVWKSPLVLGLFVGLLVSAGSLVLGSVVDWSHGWLAPMVAATGQLAALAGGAAGWLIRQAGLARRLLGPAEAVQRQIDERLAAIEAQHRVDHALAQQRLAESETKLAAAHRLLAEAEAAEAAANAELGQLTGPRLLERYLSERAGSADYGQYLGVVALAHRDLKDLDRHLQAAATQPGDDGRVDRIVLYVDDLDRCAPEVVVRVLEAVHLLLALPLFVVVVGVDVRWLVRSLRQRQPLLVETAESGLAPATPVDYLDKIFQLTYHLPVMTAQACADLLHHVAVGGSPVASRSSSAGGPAPASLEPAGAETAPLRPVARDREPVEEPDTVSQAAALQLDDIELAALRQVAPLVGASPRIAKRFVNVYRICKARVLADADLRDGDLVGLLPLTALAVGLPALVPHRLDSGVPVGDVTVGDWLRAAAPDPAEAGRVAGFLSAGAALLDLPMERLTSWLPVVRRFAWPASGRTGTAGRFAGGPG